MPKRDAASATVSGGDINVGFVYKFHDGNLLNQDLRKIALAKRIAEDSSSATARLPNNTEVVLRKSYKRKTPRQAQGLEWEQPSD
jgi:hypothetical protein